MSLALAAGIGAAGNLIGGAFSGAPRSDPKDAGDVHLANMGQQNLWNRMYQQYMGGAGDYGFGASVKAGNSQLGQFMSGRGINPQSGAGMGAYSNMVGTAAAGDAANRRDFGMNLLRSPLQTVQTSGSNWLPNSPSFGYGTDEQWSNFAGNRKNQFAGQGSPNISGYAPGYVAQPPPPTLNELFRNRGSNRGVPAGIGG